VHIDLPSIAEFPGYKFDYFISNDYKQASEIKLNKEISDNLYSSSEIQNLLDALNSYMYVNGIEMDKNAEDSNYEEKTMNET
jgi:hypothetical protein